MNYERILFGKIQLEETLLKENNIYHNVGLEYYKVKRKEEGISQKREETYGIEIIKKEYLENNVKIENKYIENITKDEKIVDNILEKLKNNEVTPISLEDIICDIKIINQFRFTF